MTAATCLTATATAEVVKFATTAPATASASARTITGLILPFGRPGRTSLGLLTASAEAVTLPDDLSRVKLFRGHSDQGGTAVGHLTAVETTAEGLVGTFQLGSGADADAALADAKEKTADGLSVELYDVQQSAGALTASALSAVALVPVPAFEDARASEVRANAHAAAGLTVPTGAATAPAGLTSRPVTAAPRALTAETVAQLLTAARTGQLHTLSPDLTAALTDITGAQTFDSVQKGWLGEVWDGIEYDRRIVPLMGRKSLTAPKMVGWKVTERPGGGAYSGDKTAVPSQGMTTAPVDVVAARWAGANDIDRAWIDFGMSEVIAAYWREMAADYALDTDTIAAQFLATNATAAGTETSLLRAVAKGSFKVATDTRKAATFALVNPTDAMGLLDVTEMNRPAYLDLFGGVALPKNYEVSPLVTAGTVIVGTKTATDFYELGDAPIRVNALDIARGGVDWGLFGYHAQLLRNPKGLVKVTVAPAPSGGQG